MRMEDRNQLLKSCLREESNIEYGEWYTIEEARAISHKNIKEYYANLNRQRSN